MASLPSPRDPFIDQRLQAALNQRGKELVGMGLVALALALALTLGSYHPSDPGWMAATDAPARNALGRVGAALAAPLVIISGKAGWGLVAALAVWGLRLIVHAGERAILARAIFVPIAVALTAVWLSSLVPGPGWQQDFGLGGMFGDTMLGAMLTALPIASTFGFNLLTILLFAAMLAMWLYVLGTSPRELAGLAAFLLAGVVLTYAGVAALVTAGLARALRAGGAGAARMQAGLAERRAQRAAAAQAAAMAAAQGGWGTPPAAAGPGFAPGAPQPPGPAAWPTDGTGWAPGGAQRVARVVRADRSEPMPADPAPMPRPAPPLGWPQAQGPAPQPPGPGPAGWAAASPAMPQAGSPVSAGTVAWQGGHAPGHPGAQTADHPHGHAPRTVPPLAADPRLTAWPPATPPHAGAAPPAEAWGGGPAPASGLLARLASAGRRLAEPVPARSLEPEAETGGTHLRREPPILAADPADHAVAPPDRIRDRIGDLLRARSRAKPVLRLDPSAEPPLRAPASQARAGAAPARPDPVRPDPVRPDPTAPAAPMGGAFGLFGLSHSFGWTAPAPATLAPPSLAPAPQAPRPGHDMRAETPTDRSPERPAVAPTDATDDDPGPEDLDAFGAPPPPRAGGVYNRRLVQPGPRKAPAPSARARAETQPPLPFDDRRPAYELPPLSLLADPSRLERVTLSDEALEENARLLESVLDDYGVRGEIVAVRPGPVVTLYELEPAPGLKASRVIGLADDIARSMSALSARVSTVPGRSVIGIELPNARREKVLLREILGSRDFGDSTLRLPLALGKDIGGEAVVANLAKMPHLLIAGTTGSGKSVAINTMILSLVYKLTPAECRLIMIDPKMLELSVYDGIPHLLSPVVTDPKKAVTALKWVVGEMEERYRRMSKMNVRNIEGYNGRVREALARGEMFKRTVQTGFDDETGDPVFETEEFLPELLPFIVVVVDEMADLMMVAGKEIEACIQRLAQMARASGIHLIMATQRPSVDVITGTIKANFPTRISFQVTSKIDSRTILGEQGAEQLLGMGDMLYMAGGSRITRVHGPFVSDEEVEEVVRHLKSFGPPAYETGVLDGPDGEREADIDAVLGLGEAAGDDALYDQAVAIVARDRKCSTSYIQRKLGIGYNKAARLVEQMETEGVVSRANQVGKREILVPEP